MKSSLTMALVAALSLIFSASAAAQEKTDAVNLRGRLGYSIGATAPLGIPEEVRGLNSFKPGANLSVGFDVQKDVAKRFGVMAGLRFEGKSMEADVDAKSYNMGEIRQGNQTLGGYFTGSVFLKVKQWMLTVPVMATCNVGISQIHVGPYVSALLSKEVTGYAYDGYLRQDTPTGAKIEMGHSPEDRGNYEFTDDLRKAQFGFVAGADWQILNHFGVYVDLSWGVTGIFHDDFKTIEQTLYPIFGTIGVAYKF